MSDFENKVELYKDNVVAKLREWDEDAAATKVYRRRLNEAGMYDSGKTKLQEILDEEHMLALKSEDENIRLKAIQGIKQSAAGPEKVVATQNNQYNFGDFLNKLKD